MLWGPRIMTCGDCSGRGECLNGTCVCEIRFTGDRCDGPNLPYHAGIGGVFLCVALVCAVQLLMCVISEYQRLKAPTLLRACRVTIQKLLYFVAFLASLIRGAYFTYPGAFKEGWSSSLLSAYYPLLMSGSSLIVCFWAEVFHLRDIPWEKPQFLSKSFLGFATFNLITYSLLLVEFVTTQIADTSAEEKSLYTHIFNGCYAVLLFIVVIFFLIYGVEVFFKVRGGFVSDIAPPSKISNAVQKKRTPSISDASEAGPSKEVTDKLVKQPVNDESIKENVSNFEQKVNTSQLHQSRVGLLSQAFMMTIIVGFLLSETLSEFWKKKVPVMSRNWHDIVFRVVEIGVAVWFPCVLWNCMHPGELWILNPRKLLRRLDFDSAPHVADKTLEAEEEGESFLATNRKDCWICYDNEKDEPLIQPCQCTGDVSSVHHECLRRWLVESASTSHEETPKCKVCGVAYEVQRNQRLDWERGFTAQHWLTTAATVTLMCVSVATAWIVIQLFEGSYVRILSISIAMLIVYLCVRFLGLNTVNAYQRAKVSSLNIVGSNHLSTISETVAVDIPKAEPASI